MSLLSAKDAVYLVDDEVGLTDSFALNLDDDYSVKCFNSAAEALSDLNDNNPPKVIISDLRMPGINGFDFIQEIRKNNKFSKIILSSGLAQKQDALRAIDLGVFAFLEKPFTSAQLKEVVARATESFIVEAEDELVKNLLELNLNFAQLNDELFSRIVLLEDNILARQGKLIEGPENIMNYQKGLARERKLLKVISQIRCKIAA